MKTEENLEVVKLIPLDRIQIETDGPWVCKTPFLTTRKPKRLSFNCSITDILLLNKCEIRPSHASAKHLTDASPLPKAVKKEKWERGCMVKGRNEPVAIANVAHVIAKVKGISVKEVCEA